MYVNKYQQRRFPDNPALNIKGNMFFISFKNSSNCCLCFLVLALLGWVDLGNLIPWGVRKANLFGFTCYGGASPPDTTGVGMAHFFNC